MLAELSPPKAKRTTLSIQAVIEGGGTRLPFAQQVYIENPLCTGQADGSPALSCLSGPL